MKRMEWPKELLAVFDDPLLDGVRPKVAPPTADDRMRARLAEVNNWIAMNGREPQKTGNLKEKLMWAAMTALKERNLM